MEMEVKKEELDMEKMREKMIMEIEKAKMDTRNEKEKMENIKKTVSCPISRDIFIEPVIAEDGHTYEREYLERWLERNNISPMTGKKLVKDIFLIMQSKA